MVLWKGSFRYVITQKTRLFYNSSRWYYLGSKGPWREDLEVEPSIYESFPEKKKKQRCHSKFRPSKPSKESELVIQQLLLAQEKSQKQVDTTFTTKFSRLLSKDMKHVFISFVKSQNFDLAFKVFELMREQSWYEPVFTPYEQLIQSYCHAEGGNKPMMRVYELLVEAERAGLGVTRRMSQHPIKCCLAQNDIETCMKIYEKMRKSGLVRHYPFYINIVRALEKAGFQEYANKVRADHSELASSSVQTRKSTFVGRYLNK